MRVPRTLILVTLAFAVFLAATGACVSPSSNTDFSELSEAVRALQDNFIDKEKLTAEELNRAAIRGIIEYLDDPYTSYLAPRRFQDYSESLDGRESRFEGIGAQVTIRNGDIMILGPLPGSPASRAGIRPGDIVLRVDGASVEGMELMEAVDLIRGPKGSDVMLLVSRAGELRPIEITVTRDEILETSVSARVHAEGIGVVQLHGFDAKTAKNLRNAIAQLRDEGVEGLVLDLRYNAGGLLDAAVDVVSEFMEEGPVLIWQEADGAETVYNVGGAGSAYDIPLVVITNGFTASAAEIVTGALQDHGRATVVGATTFGKGSVNSLLRLQSGSGLSVTTARWLTPHHRVIEGEGLQPDIAVASAFDPDDPRHRIAALARSLCETFGEDRDALSGQHQLASALEELCGQDAAPPAPPEGDAQLDVAVETLRSLMDARQ